MGKVAKKKAAPVAPAKRTAPAPAPPKQIASPASTAVAPANLADMLREDAGAGLHRLDASKDLAVPRLGIVQATSAILKKTEATYDPDAEAGMIIENVSNALYEGEKGVLLVLVLYRRTYVSWWPFGSRLGKGFIKDYGTDDSILAKTTRDEKTGANLLPDGSEIVMTAEYFALMVDEETGAVERMLVPMAKMQFSKSKKLLTQATTLIASETGKPAPLFYRSYRFSIVPESNDKGNWFGWKIEPGPKTLELPNGENIYLMARAYRQGAEQGTVKVSAPGEAEGATGAAAPGEDAPM